MNILKVFSSPLLNGIQSLLIHHVLNLPNRVGLGNLTAIQFWMAQIEKVFHCVLFYKIGFGLDWVRPFIHVSIPIFGLEVPFDVNKKLQIKVLREVGHKR